MSAVLEYIRSCPAEHRTILRNMRRIIKLTAPEAEEGISYGMPCFRHNGALVWFALFKKHLGFYPTSSGIREFEKELGGYAYSKGAIRFPLDEPLPEKLIARIVRFRMKENRKKAGRR